jgi:hypothetical protein
MEEAMRPTTAPCDTLSENNVFELNALLHPGTVFNHPNDVVAHSKLSLSEKRAILASWASDASAIASCPALRAPPALKKPVSIDEILEALTALDGGPREPHDRDAGDRRRPRSCQQPELHQSPESEYHQKEVDDVISSRCTDPAARAGQIAPRRPSRHHPLTDKDHQLASDPQSEMSERAHAVDFPLAARSRRRRSTTSP